MKNIKLSVKANEFEDVPNYFRLKVYDKDTDEFVGNLEFQWSPTITHDWSVEYELNAERIRDMFKEFCEERNIEWQNGVTLDAIEFENMFHKLRRRRCEEVLSSLKLKFEHIPVFDDKPYHYLVFVIDESNDEIIGGTDFVWKCHLKNNFDKEVDLNYCVLRNTLQDFFCKHMLGPVDKFFKGETGYRLLAELSVERQIKLKKLKKAV